jgi:hypothetical protein
MIKEKNVLGATQGFKLSLETKDQKWYQTWYLGGISYTVSYLNIFVIFLKERTPMYDIRFKDLVKDLV